MRKIFPRNFFNPEVCCALLIKTLLLLFFKKSTWCISLWKEHEVTFDLHITAILYPQPRYSRNHVVFIISWYSWLWSCFLLIFLPKVNYKQGNFEPWLINQVHGPVCQLLHHHHNIFWLLYHLVDKDLFDLSASHSAYSILLECGLSAGNSLPFGYSVVHICHANSFVPDVLNSHF